ncbi:uncharacterized protein LOC134232814 [Saccostrea cucullata]|uniref:uncharacterized protein LOC134232814 n=1 Tax=Saccostrea cuccullata TaxID=36930 RepID=UPI002ED45826
MLQDSLQKMQIVRNINTFLLLSISLHNVLCVDRSCQWSKRTIEDVTKCPLTVEEVEKAANIKNCKALAQKQNCTDPSNFKYHCVINEEEDSLVEVCAPAYYIHGFCTEFNVKGLLIQPHFSIKCNNITPCSERYLSTLAYQFPKCYDVVKKRTFSPLINETTTISFDSSDSAKGDGVIKWYIYFLIVFVITACFVFVPVFVVCMCGYRRKQEQQRNDLNEEGVVSQELLRKEAKKERRSESKMESDSISRESITDELVVVAPGRLLIDMYHESEEEREQYAVENEDHTKSYLNAFQHFEKYFVKTKVFTVCKNKLQTEGVAVLVGPPGYGKTNIGIGIMKDDVYKDWKKRKIKSWAEFRFINSEENSLIYIDNIFDGFMYHHELEKWWNILNKTFYDNISHNPNDEQDESEFFANKGGKIHLFITAKESVLTKAREYNKIKRTPVFKRNCIINVTDYGFTATEKDEILDKQFEFAEKILDIPRPLVDQEFRNKMKELVGPIGFPLCAHLYACEKDHRNTGIDFFLFPINYLRKQIKYEIEGDQTHGVKTLLLLLFLSECLSLSNICVEKLNISDSDKCKRFLEKNFSEEMLESFESLNFEDLATVANKLTVTLIGSETECMYQLKHQIIFDAVGFYFCTECFNVAIKYFPIGAFQKHEYINPSEEFCDIFSSRIIDEVHSGNVSEALSCVALKQYHFAQRVCDILKSKNDVESFLLETDSVTVYPLPSVFWISKYEHIILSKLLYELVQEKGLLVDHTFYLARFGDCCANDENFLRNTAKTVFNSTTEIMNCVFQYKNHKGMTVLHIVLTSERPDYDAYLIIKKLLEDCKSKTLCDSDKQCAVYFAANEVRYSRILCILALFDSKIDIKKSFPNDTSPIHIVLKLMNDNSHKSVPFQLEMLIRVCIFIIYGVDSKMKKSNDRRSVKDMCKNTNCKYIKELLCSNISKSQKRMSELIQTLLRELPVKDRNEKVLEEHVLKSEGRLDKSLRNAISLAVQQLAGYIHLSENER